MSEREKYNQERKAKVKEMAQELGLESLLCNASFFNTLAEMVVFNMNVNY